jgi:glycosyltransferase involved in cell wall biosynthesis
MIDRLRSAGVQVEECQVALWHGLEDRAEVAGGGWRSPAFWWRVLTAYAQLLSLYFKAGAYDIMVLGYPGQPDVLLARLLTWIKHKPLVWDVYMSIYLIACERGLDKRSPRSVRLIQGIEQLALKFPDRLIHDTQEYAAWFQETYKIPQEKIRLVPQGADERVYRPLPQLIKQDGSFLCLYFGTYIPNHGVEFILEAARLLQNEPAIQFEMIGRGPELPSAKALAQEYQLNNLTFIEWLEPEALANKAAAADVLLGTFGVTPQSMMTVQNKIHQAMAMRRPVINGRSPAIESTLVDGKQLLLCDRQDGASLAAAIRRLFADRKLCETLAEEGYNYYCENLTIERTGLLFKGHLLELLEGPPSASGKGKG